MSIRLLVLATLLGATQSVYSQAIDTCSSVAADADGDGFGWENNASCRVTAGSLTAPQFINQETGNPVSLTRAYWNEEDFHQRKDLICREHYFNGSSYISFRLGILLDFQPLAQSSPYQGTVTVYGGAQQTDFLFENIPWSLENGIYSGPTALGFSPWVEIVDSHGKKATRTWTSNFGYTQCNSINPDPASEFAPTGNPAPADTGFDGSCVDTDPVGDGWGWDGVTSCPITTTNTQVTTTNTCVDTAPVGDGWGWDGTTSCVITKVCVDTAPVGDGWGWDGTASCVTN